MKKVYQEFFSNSIIKPLISQKKTFLFSAFYAFFTFSHILDYYHIDLKGFPRGIISIATLDKIDIGLRISTFYHSLFFAFLVFFVAGYLLYLITNGSRHLRIIGIYLNYLSFMGILGLFLELTSKTSSELVVLSIVFQILILLIAAIERIFFPRKEYFMEKDYVIWIALSAFLVMFLVRYTGQMTKNENVGVSFLTWYSIVVILSALIVSFLRRKMNYSFRSIVFYAKPIVFLPLLPVISNEVYLIFNQRGIHLLSPKILSVLFFIALIGGTLWRSQHIRDKSKMPSVRRFLAKTYIPLFIVSIGIFVTYRPVIDQSREIFELANPANSVLRIFRFHEIPLLHFLSSHLLSEQILPSIYVILNGFDGTVSFMTYNFIYGVFALLVIYWVVKKIFNNPILALFVTLFYPFIEILFPESICFDVLSMLLLLKVLPKPTFGKLAFYIFWIFITCLWKPEVGLSVTIVSGIVLGIYLFSNYSKQLLIQYVKALAVVALPIVIIVVFVSMIKGIHLESNLRQAYEYFSANQAHGLKPLTWHKDRYFIYHYFIIPIVILILLMIYLKKFRLKNYKVKPLVFAFVFISGIYFINVQRGLVRHSMIEGSEMFMTSFSFLLISIAGTDLLSKYTRSGMIFLAISTILISNLKYPNSEGYQALSGKFMDSWSSKLLIDKSNKKIDRVKGSGEFERKQCGDLKQFLNANLPAKATFYDFSNTPMLYFYLERNIPSYFNQIPICANSPYLQKVNMAEIKNKDIPIVIYSNVPRNFWDDVDGVPNDLRHYVISSWIFTHFQPFAIIDNHSIWVKKAAYENYMKRYTKVLFSGSLPPNRKIDLNDSISYKFLTVKVKFDRNWYGTISLNHISLKSYWTDADSCNYFFVPDSLRNRLDLISSQKVKTLSFIAMKYCPDTLSRKQEEYNLKYLPQIMGEYYNEKMKTATKKEWFVNNGNIEYPDTTELKINKPNNSGFLYIMTKPLKNNGEVIIQYSKFGKILGSYRFIISPESKNDIYIVAPYTQYNWFSMDPDNLRIICQGTQNSVIKQVGFITFEK